jgi:hypothetical protein
MQRGCPAATGGRKGADGGWDYICVKRLRVSEGEAVVVRVVGCIRQSQGLEVAECDLGV